ncbi:MAG: protein kinase family protein, partial [Nocardioidaceae bacterium]
MDQRVLSSGIVLSDRYQLEDLINESSGASTWLARDKMLDRRVGVQALPSDDRRAEGFAEAARRSTGVTDPHFLRVLDIAEHEHGHTYLVREWARALPLDLVLTQSTLTNRRSATVIAEVAEAIGNAHESGVFHRHLQPGCILLKESGAVRITGLAVDHAIRSPDPDPEHSDLQYAEQLDVQSIGKLLYACLSGRWPGGGSGMLRKAPTEHGRLLRPRQVRAGVSRDVDTVCDRVLGTPPRHHETPLRSARQIAHELRM